MRHAGSSSSSFVVLFCLWLLSPWNYQVSSLATPRGRNEHYNKRRQEEGYTRRKQTTGSGGSRSSKAKRKTKKRTPRWEKEGDELYQEIQIENSNEDVDYDQAKLILSELQYMERTEDSSKYNGERSTATDNANEDKKKQAAPAHMLWGTLPVGPILAKNLNCYYSSPNPIQQEAFVLLSKGTNNNAVIASPTGTGKTLAFLVPLLATRISQNKPFSMLIVTPTVELAAQIRNQVDIVWARGDQRGDDDHNKCYCCVVGEARRQYSIIYSPKEEQDEEQDDNSSLLSPEMTKAPILAGTPRMLRALLRELKEEDKDLVAQVSRLFESNLKTIVLDEADRLLRTEGVAREKAASSTTKKHIRSKSMSQTEQLLRNDIENFEEKQLICASATVGRTLRRQLMMLLNSPSIDAAATLITADARLGKDAAKRVSSLLPTTLEHRYHLVESSSSSKSKAESQQELLEAIGTSLKRFKPDPLLIFPNRLGVDLVQQYLRNQLGLVRVYSLSDLKDLDTKKTATATYNSWNETPIFVISDKFARGLDLPFCKYVLLLAPPSSAAGYTHLAGRTGRNGNVGIATTIVFPRNAKKLSEIAKRLALPFHALADFVSDKDSQKEGVIADPISDWKGLSQSAIQRKTVGDLKTFLKQCDYEMDDSMGRVLKEDLIAAVNHVLSNASRG